MFRRDTLLIGLAVLLAFCVVTLGAYVRLSDAGLGCPDWPGCYGHLSVPSTPDHAAANAAYPDRPVESHKAWKEMIHRYAAGTLGLLILAITLQAWQRHQRQRYSPAVPTALLLLVIFQGLLGMWTVTLLLKPAVVTAHLLGGMSTFGLLLWLFCQRNITYGDRASLCLRGWAGLALLLLLGQIALGGWVSSNYAALVCPEFPYCRAGDWWPPADFAQGFQLHRPLGYTAEGSLITTDAMTAIHLSHRVGALGILVVIGSLAMALRKHGVFKGLGTMLFFTLCLQAGLGITNVLGSMPLPIAVAHNAGAALLLATLIITNARLWVARR